jgi:hypothetical protein
LLYSSIFFILVFSLPSSISSFDYFFILICFEIFFHYIMCTYYMYFICCYLDTCIKYLGVETFYFKLITTELPVHLNKLLFYSALDNLCSCRQRRLIFTLTEFYLTFILGLKAIYILPLKYYQKVSKTLTQRINQAW